jgi:hypothetical protein
MSSVSSGGKAIAFAGAWFGEGSLLKTGPR